MSPGDTIAGKYSLIRPVGRGSMGEVWAALHVEMQRTVALKLIFEGSADLALRLKREALACGRLEHPNIVRIYDIGETTAGDPFLVMELLQGETLAERQARGPRLTPVEALEVTLQIARALKAAHGAGVVHRDLKPANVYLHLGPDAEAEQVKVLDFGVSKLLALDDSAHTVTGALVGSPAYMSPEAARALKQIDPRADLWSLGVLLFELLTGSRPFGGTTVFGVVAEILAGEIPTLASALPGVDPRLDAAVGRCLTRALEERMPSAAALIDALTPVLVSMIAPAGVAELPVLTSDVDEQATLELHQAAVRVPFPRPASARPLPPPAVEDEEATRAWRPPEPEPEKTTTEMRGERAVAFRREIAAKVAGRAPVPEADTMPMPRRLVAPTARMTPPPPPGSLVTARMTPPPPAQDPWGSGPADRRPAPRGPDPSAFDARLTLPPEWERRPQVSYVPLITALAVVALALLAIIAFTLLSQASEAPDPSHATPSTTGGRAR